MINKVKLGDIIAKLAKILNIPHCPKCEKRRLILNEIQKIGLKETVKRMAAVDMNTERESQTLKEVVHKLTDCCKE